MEKNESLSQSSEEMITIAASRNKELCILWKAYGAKALQQWGTGMLELVQQASLLRCGVHGESEKRGSEDRDELGCYAQVCKSSEGARLLRNLRESRKDGCTPCRRESVKQLGGELDAAVQTMPQFETQEAENLLDMWEAAEGIGILQSALHTLQEVWGPVRNSVSEKSGGTQTRKYVLRRLLPTECLLLQGFPKWWVDGANGSDSAIYRAAGNSLAVPCAVDILGRIARFVKEEETL